MFGMQRSTQSGFRHFVATALSTAISSVPPQQIPLLPFQLQGDRASQTCEGQEPDFRQTQDAGNGAP
ncbi:hypothetical protein GN956_G5970 [Arapaima gigas]